MPPIVKAFIVIHPYLHFRIPSILIVLKESLHQNPLLRPCLRSLWLVLLQGLNEGKPENTSAWNGCVNGIEVYIEQPSSSRLPDTRSFSTGISFVPSTTTARTWGSTVWAYRVFERSHFSKTRVYNQPHAVSNNAVFIFVFTFSELLLQPVLLMRTSSQDVWVIQ